MSKFKVGDIIEVKRKMKILKNIKEKLDNYIKNKAEETEALREIKKKVRASALEEREKQEIELAKKKEQIRAKRMLEAYKKPQPSFFQVIGQYQPEVNKKNNKTKVEDEVPIWEIIQ